jgi:hypothetical protein
MTAPLQALQNVRVQGDRLCFTIDKEPVQLHLGAKVAGSWTKKIKALPASLADKLGITGKTVRTVGSVFDHALDSALTSAAQIRAEKPDVIVACIDTPESLTATLRDAKKQLADGVPLWLVYRKGPGHPLNEAAIRTALRAHGLMDTKVASVSSELTALRFNLRKFT